MQHQKIIQHIVNWLKSYAEQSQTNGFVVGISGGIDSALTSTLCALTQKKVFCLNMPIHQHQDEFNRSLEHINWLQNQFKNVISETVNLTLAFDAILNTWPTQIQDDLTIANAHSRLRMLNLYAYAGHHKLLVVGTGNKIEDFGIGFFTKYGDGGVDISPIADLMKSTVYKLAKELQVIDSILNAAPTDGLFADGRNDETQIGASYDELEWAMNFNKTSNIHLTQRQKEVLEIYEKRHVANQHKMNPIPICKIPTEFLD